MTCIWPHKSCYQQRDFRKAPQMTRRLCSHYGCHGDKLASVPAMTVIAPVTPYPPPSPHTAGLRLWTRVSATCTLTSVYRADWARCLHANCTAVSWQRAGYSN